MAGTRHPTDWEQQRERLSAYLDGELTAAERAALERHLPSCPECALELRELRRVRALLGALPAPAAPRSFALPITSPQASPRGAAAAPAPRASTTTARPAWYRASQWVGGVAACIGLFLLLGTALLGNGGLYRSGAPQFDKQAPISGASAQSTRTPMDARATSPSQDGVATQAPATAPTATAPILSSPAPPPPNESGAPFEPILGAGLLAGGLALLVAGRVARRSG